MSLSNGQRKPRAEIVASHQRGKSDTCSPEVQIALLTDRITHLTQHLGQHPKDRHSQRGMLEMIGRRKRLLQYLQAENKNRYRQTIDALGLRK